jgi:hypothetical protein
LLATVIARLSPSSTHSSPAFKGTLKADSLILGPVTLESFNADLSVASDSTDLTAVDAELLGGQLHVAGKIENGAKPSYTLEGTFQNVNAADLCGVLVLKCTGSSFDGSGKLELAGYEGKDLAASAKGALHFVWKKGSIERVAPADAPLASQAPAVLGRFDAWRADADVANGALTVTDSHVELGKRATPVSASIIFADPPKVSFGAVENLPAVKK